MANQKTNKYSRRQFLGIAWGGSIALVLAQVTVALIKFIQPVSTGGFGGRIYAGQIEEFTVNSVNRILAGRFFISRTEDGIIALWQKCTHLGCAVPWDEDKGVFHCPCHGSIFDEVGDVLGGPAPRALDFFPVDISSSEVWVDTSQPTERSKHDPDHITGA